MAKYKYHSRQMWMYKEGIVFMDYRTILQEENDAVRERLDLSMERVTAMEEEDIRQPYGNYFRCVSRFILMIGELVKERQEGRKLFLTQLQERNHRLYEDILPEHYEESFANPDYAVKELGGSIAARITGEFSSSATSTAARIIAALETSNIGTA